MTHEINLAAENVEELLDAAMEIYPYSAARFLGGETVEIWFADTELELSPIVQRMKQRPGETSLWAKSN